MKLIGSPLTFEVLIVMVLIGWREGFLTSRQPYSKSFRGNFVRRSNGQTSLFSSTDPSSYEKLSRCELQTLAKSFHIPANIKSADIILELCKRNDLKSPLSIGQAADGSEEGVDEDSDEDSEEYLEVLRKQGIGWEDIYAFQENIAMKAPLVSIKQGKKAKCNSGATNTHSKSLSTVQHLGKTLSYKSVTVPSFIKTQNAEQRAIELQEKAVRRTTSQSTHTSFRESTPGPNRGSYGSPRSQVHVSLEGATLKDMMEYLINTIGFPTLFAETNLRCFDTRPTLQSSLKVLRQSDMEWARKKIEYLYITEKKR